VPLETYFLDERVNNVDPGVLFTPSSRFRNVWEWSIVASPGIGG
jgi:hypothetical protein